MKHPKDRARGFGTHTQRAKNQLNLHGQVLRILGSKTRLVHYSSCAKCKIKTRISNLSVAQHLSEPQASLSADGQTATCWLASVVASIFLCLLLTLSPSNSGSSRASPSVPLCYLAYSSRVYFRHHCITFLSSLFECICHPGVVISQE